MTGPAPFADTPEDPALFTAVADVTGRYEGDFPASKANWVQNKIVDVESILIGLVPSLGAVPPDQIDARRRRNVVALVAAKVLDLYRNPSGSASVNQSMDGISATFTQRATTTSQEVWFSAQELASVQPTLKRPRPAIGTWSVSPWNPAC